MPISVCGPVDRPAGERGSRRPSRRAGPRSSAAECSCRSPRGRAAPRTSRPRPAGRAGRRRARAAGAVAEGLGRGTSTRRRRRRVMPPRSARPRRDELVGVEGRGRLVGLQLLVLLQDRQRAVPVGGDVVADAARPCCWATSGSTSVTSSTSRACAFWSSTLPDQLISAWIDSSGLAWAALTACSVALTKRRTRSGFFSHHLLAGDDGVARLVDADRRS